MCANNISPDDSYPLQQTNIPNIICHSPTGRNFLLLCIQVNKRFPRELILYSAVTPSEHTVENKIWRRHTGWGRHKQALTNNLWAVYCSILEHGRGMRVSKKVYVFNNVSWTILTPISLSQATMIGYPGPFFAGGSFGVEQHVHFYTSEVLPLVLKHYTT
eukprot:sb/3472875/